jgi:hypothetical protein
MRNHQFWLLFRYQMAAGNGLPFEGRLRLRPLGGQHVPELSYGALRSPEREQRRLDPVGVANSAACKDPEPRYLSVFRGLWSDEALHCLHSAHTFARAPLPRKRVRSPATPRHGLRAGESALGWEACYETRRAGSNAGRRFVRRAFRFALTPARVGCVQARCRGPRGYRRRSPRIGGGLPVAGIGCSWRAIPAPDGPDGHAGSTGVPGAPDDGGRAVSLGSRAAGFSSGADIPPRVRREAA